VCLCCAKERAFQKAIRKKCHPKERGARGEAAWEAFNDEPSFFSEDPGLREMDDI